MTQSAKRVVPDREVLEAAYVRDRLGLQDVARRYGVSSATVRRWLITRHIPRRPARTPVGRVVSIETRAKISARQRLSWPTKSALERAYLVDGFTMRELGAALGVSATCISKRFRALGIQAKAPHCDGRFLFDSLTARQHHTPRRFPNGQRAYQNLVFGIERRPRVCTECGSTRHIHVHHKDENRGNNASDNLQVLCKRCHAKHHRINSPLDWRRRSA